LRSFDVLPWLLVSANNLSVMDLCIIFNKYVHVLSLILFKLIKNANKAVLSLKKILCMFIFLSKKSEALLCVAALGYDVHKCLYNTIITTKKKNP